MWGGGEEKGKGKVHVVLSQKEIVTYEVWAYSCNCSLKSNGTEIFVTLHYLVRMAERSKALRSGRSLQQ